MAAHPTSDASEPIRADLAEKLSSALQDAAFDNRYSLHPRRLEQLGGECAEDFLGFLSSPDQ
jgi:hypothetical protein